MDHLLNPKQLAEILSVKPGTVYSWLSRGIDLPPFIKISGSTRWREKAVMDWITAREKERKRKNFAD
jgi:predicted DNA-binding transcriptional regulator AlpA